MIALASNLTDAVNIFNYLEYGIYLREVMLPTDNPDFKMIKDGNKWRANMIILGTRFDLFCVATYNYLIEKGANVHTNYDNALRYSAKNGYFDVVKYLIEKGANVHTMDDEILRLSAAKGYLDIVKYLAENNANIHSMDEYALRYSACNGARLNMQHSCIFNRRCK